MEVEAHANSVEIRGRLDSHPTGPSVGTKLNHAVGTEVAFTSQPHSHTVVQIAPISQQVRNCLQCLSGGCEGWTPFWRRPRLRW